MLSLSKCTRYLPSCMEYGSCLKLISTDKVLLRYLQLCAWYFIGEIEIKSQFKAKYISVFFPTSKDADLGT